MEDSKFLEEKGRVQYLFGRSETNIAKGVAILLMLWHHLFLFPDRLLGVSFMSLASSWLISPEARLADFGKLCVAMFLFLSGYGFYQSAQRNKDATFFSAVVRCKRFMFQYWLCFAVFIPIGLVFFNSYPQYSWDTKAFLLNFIGVSSSYNHEWWFIALYLELILLFPLFFRLLKWDYLWFVIVTFAISLFALKLKIMFLGSDFFEWQMAFAVGMLFARFNGMNKMAGLFDCKGLLGLGKCTLLCVLCLLLRERLSSFNIDAFLAPVFIAVVVALVKNCRADRIFIFLGNQSLYMWLTHSFFCYYYWQQITYAPRYPVLIFLWLVILSVTSSLVLNAFGRLLFILRNKFFIRP